MSEKVIQTKIRSGNKKLSGDKIKTGPCVFPYTYKGEIYNECFKGKYGDWCATEVDKDTQKITKYSFFDYKKKKLQQKKKNQHHQQPRRKQPRRNLLRRHQHQHQLPKRNQLKRAHRHKAPFPPKKHLLRKKEKSIRSNQETHYKV